MMNIRLPHCPVWLRRAVLLCLIAVGACRSLPTVTPDMAASQGPPHVAGTRGPLSAARSKAVLDALKSRAPDTNLFDRHLALEEALAGRPLVAGNKVTLLHDFNATHQAMFAAIRDARDHINMETYIFEDDEVGVRFRDALIAKQREGVAVSLIYDAVGAVSTPREFFAPLRDAGVRLLEFNPINPLIAKAAWSLNERDHRKLLIVDGRTVFLGGINISGIYSGSSTSSAGERPKPWRDTHLQVEGPVVADFQKLYLETWAKQKADPLPQRNYFPPPTARGKEVVRAIAGAPDEPVSAIYATLISAVDHAETEILMTNAYFAPDPQLRASLKAAVQRGVSVKLILPSATDSGLIFHAGRSYYDELLRAGIRIFERRNVLLHAKTVVIDGVWSTIGSANLDWRSFLHNQEANAVVLGTEFAQQMRAMFDNDLASSNAITLEQWDRRGLGARLKQGLARMWEYWL
ncbi:phospholipase D-like domain-containing protein [Piscinibacter sp. XHJ-5]|uniref:phospholipase D-like domain-containing protein n=1 Tax=Piscinibacter sp. XHJ-5 TaxID=3037797 RepID=UPI0024530836|nr:phospholipase D-like domain-containing protein [Piscinibacter sp. XHJ-5]